MLAARHNDDDDDIYISVCVGKRENKSDETTGIL